MNTAVKWLNATTTGLIAGFLLVAGMATAQEGGPMDVPRPTDKQISYSPIPSTISSSATIFWTTSYPRQPINTSYT